MGQLTLQTTSLSAPATGSSQPRLDFILPLPCPSLLRSVFHWGSVHGSQTKPKIITFHLRLKNCPCQYQICPLAASADGNDGEEGDALPQLPFGTDPVTGHPICSPQALPFVPLCPSLVCGLSMISASLDLKFSKGTSRVCLSLYLILVIHRAPWDSLNKYLVKGVPCCSVYDTKRWETT